MEVYLDAHRIIDNVRLLLLKVGLQLMPMSDKFPSNACLFSI